MTVFSPAAGAQAAPTPLPAPPLPARDPDTLTLHNALHRVRQPLSFDWHGRRASLRVMPKATNVSADMTVAVRLGGERLILAASWPTFARLGEHPDRRRALNEVDPELAALWLEAVWLPWLEPLEAMFGVGIRVEPAAPQARPANPVDVMLAFDLDGETHPLHVGLTTAAAERLLPLFDRCFPTQRSRAEGVPVTLNLVFGDQTLTLGEWRSLRPGDVVMLEPFVHDDPDGAALRVADRLGCSVVLEADGVRLKGPLAPLAPSRASNPPCDENLMSEPPVDNDKSSSGPQTDVDNPSLDALPVRLTCELGSVEISLGELRELGEGSVLPLERRPERAVDLLVNGRRMGHGRLVAIGDGIGVQIERLSLDE